MTRYLYDSDGIYLYPYECQIDPLESKIKGEPVYMIPVDSTDIEPPAISEGETLRFVDGAWTVETPPPVPEIDPDTLPPSQEERLAALESAMLTMMMGGMSGV